VGFTIGKLLPEKEKGFSPIFNFGIEAISSTWYVSTDKNIVLPFRSAAWHHCVRFAPESAGSRKIFVHNPYDMDANRRSRLCLLKKEKFISIK
jgi:hypothetical protein